MPQNRLSRKSQAGVSPVNPAVQTIAILKASLVNLGMYMLNHDEWGMVESITQVVSGRYAHD